MGALHPAWQEAVWQRRLSSQYHGHHGSYSIQFMCESTSLTLSVPYHYPGLDFTAQSRLSGTTEKHVSIVAFINMVSPVVHKDELCRLAGKW